MYFAPQNSEKSKPIVKLLLDQFADEYSDLD